jgi:diguanylate cyclase (GGDEF)-like protein
VHVTVSVGAVSTAADGADPEHLVRAADQALYGAKRDGRNRVTMLEGAGSGPR